MKLSSAVLRATLVFVAFILIQSVTGILIPIKAPPVPHQLPWLLLSQAVTVGALALAAVRTEWRGFKMGMALAAISLAITSINLIEGIFFLKNSPLDWGKIFLMAVISAVFIGPVWALLFGRRPEPSAAHYHPIRAKSRGERAWKFVISDLIYVFLYFGAGTIIFPYVKSFYATQGLPSAGAIAGMQLLVRGPAFVLICLALTRMLGLGRLRGAFAVGMVFALVSGVAPLLIPNPFFPDAVRWVHFCEVVSENFVFGAAVAWLWGQPQQEQAQVLRNAA